MSDIIVKFEPRGHEKIVTAIKAIQAAEKNLTVAGKKHNVVVANMTAKLKAQNLSWKKLGVNLKTVGQAAKGNRVAMQKLNIAIKKTSSGLFNITSQGRLLDNTFATLRSKILLVSFGMGLITTGLIKQVKAFAKQEKSVMQMARVFGTDGANALDKYSSSLQAVTRFGDENINILMSQIGAFGANVEQTKQLTEATLNLSEGLGIDLNSAGLLVAKSFGSSTNALSRYGIEVDSNMTKQEKLGAITEGINSRFGDLAKLLAQTTSGQLEQANNAFGDLQERIGEALAPTVLAFANTLKVMADALPLSAFRAMVGAVTGLTAGFVAGKIAVQLHAAATAVWTIKTSAATIATKGFKNSLLLLNKSLKKGGFMAIVSVLGTLIGTIQAYRSANDDLSESEQKLQDRINDMAKSMGLSATLDREKLKSIIDTEDAIKKQIAVMKAELTVSGSALEIRKKEIELGRDLEESEKELIRSKHILIQTKEYLNSETEKENALMGLVINAYNSTAEAQFNKLQLDINELEIRKQKGLLSEEEIKGLKLQKKALQDLQIQNISNLKFDEMSSKTRRKFAADAMSAASGLLGLNKKNALIAGRLDQGSALINTYTAVTDVLKEGTGPYRYVEAAAALAFGLKQVSAIESQLSQMGGGGSGGGGGQVFGSFEQGGYVGGNRHSQGGTIIEAERGEFVMSRNAVESIGLETLNQMNQSGGGGSINVSVTGNVLTQDFVEGELAESIKEAVRRGSDFGIG